MGLKVYINTVASRVEPAHSHLKMLWPLHTVELFTSHWTNRRVGPRGENNIC